MSLTVELRQGIAEPAYGEVRVATRGGLVYLHLGRKTIEMKTPTAVDIGLKMVKLSDDALPVDFIVLSANGESADFPVMSARQIGAAILRKADDADDFQLRKN